MGVARGDMDTSMDTVMQVDGKYFKSLYTAVSDSVCSQEVLEVISSWVMLIS